MYRRILEFDRGNIKMRLILASSYLREDLVDQALAEYVIAADYLLGRKQYQEVLDALQPVLE